MEKYMIWLWLSVFVIFIVGELATVQLTTIWFAIGAAVSLFLAAFGVANIAVQVITFFLVSLLTLIATRPLVKKYINNKTQPTNADRCIGAKAIVTEEINNILAKGEAKVNGMSWTARSATGNIIPVGTMVTVKSIDGVKLIVE